jgi:integrase
VTNTATSTATSGLSGAGPSRWRQLSYAAIADLFASLSSRRAIAATPHMFRHTYTTRLLGAGSDYAAFGDPDKWREYVAKVQAAADLYADKS